MLTRNEQWQRARELFDTVVELETGARKLFLDKACAGDTELRGEVLSLLEADKAESFIERPAYEVAAELFAGEEDDDRAINRRFGAYRIIREIGRGGMGAVYLAERADDEYQKRVAIKIIKRGMDTDHVLRRFRNERQILAQLEHPNIARLIDGGMTEDGLPYFVMEYVEGQALNDYADSQHLSTIQRLDLFRTICSAVAYAHQNLIIHRDLKPSNILVTADGAPKLLDFGIAKLLHHGEELTPEMLTMTGLRVMTPEYASPEQMRGERVTMATDVYSLGVVLYELLTGVHPFRRKKLRPDELARVICEEEPERPSRAISDRGVQNAESKDNPQSEIRNAKFLRGDLDNIILVAMRKEPQRRYSSVGQFSEDIRRHLEGLPVRAHKDTLAYRTTKFVQRNKIAAIAAAFIFLSLLAGISISVWQAFVAKEQARMAARERDKAHVEAAKAARVSSFMQNIFLLANQRFNSPGRNLKGSKLTAVDMLDEASKRIDTELADQPDVRAQLHHTIGDTYLTFQRFDAAEEHFRAALQLSREVYGERNPKVANDLYHLAATLGHKDELSEADKLYRQAIAMMRQTDAANANLPHMLRDYGGLRLLEYGDVETAEPLLRESLAIFKRKYGEEYVMVALLNGDLAEVALARNELDKAEAMYRDSLTRFNRLSASTDQNNRQSINHTNICLARIALKKGNYAEAETSLRGVLDGKDESGPDYDSLTLTCDAFLAQLHYRTGAYDKAEAEFKRVLEIERSILRADHRGMIEPLCALSEVLSKEGKTKEAVSRYDEASAIYDRRTGDPLKDAELKSLLGESLTALGRYAEAEPLLIESYDNLKVRLGEQNSFTIEARRRLNEFYEARGNKR